MYLKLKREKDNGVQTIGTMELRDNYGKIIFSMKTLELTWKENQKQISCIPCGWYAVKKRYSIKYGWHFHILNVTNRDLILIHSGNFFFESLGCILIGKYLEMINNDFQIDVKKSRSTMKILLSLANNEMTLKIENSKFLWQK